MRLGVVRFNRNRLVITLERVPRLGQVHQGAAAVVVSLCIARLERDGFVVAGNRRLGLPQVPQDIASVVEGESVTRIDLNGPVKQLKRLRKIFCLRGNHTQQMHRVEMPGLQLEYLQVTSPCLGKLPSLMQGQPAGEAGLRLHLRRVPGGDFCLRRFSGLGLHGLLDQIRLLPEFNGSAATRPCPAA